MPPLPPSSPSSPLSLLLFLLLSSPPITTSFSPSPYYTANWCDNEGQASLQYLDDSECAKVFPSSPVDRDFSCPVFVSSPDDPSLLGYTPDSVPLSLAPVDVTSLEAAGVPSDIPLCVVLSKRVAGTEGNTTLHTRRLCAGGGERESFETWSSSKVV